MPKLIIGSGNCSLLPVQIGSIRFYHCIFLLPGMLQCVSDCPWHNIMSEHVSGVLEQASTYVSLKCLLFLLIVLKKSAMFGIGFLH